MFKKFVKSLVEATTSSEIYEILEGVDGVDMMFQREKLKWEEHELLFKMGNEKLKYLDIMSK